VQEVGKQERKAKIDSDGHGFEKKAVTTSIKRRNSENGETSNQKECHQSKKESRACRLITCNEKRQSTTRRLANESETTKSGSMPAKSRNDRFCL
jgi:hypothetical protein